MKQVEYQWPLHRLQQIRDPVMQHELPTGLLSLRTAETTGHRAGYQTNGHKQTTSTCDEYQDSW